MGNQTECLLGKRYRRVYRNEDIYVLLFNDEKTGMPSEVFVRFDQEHKDPTKFLTEAGWDAFTRMLSGWLQHPDIFPYAKTIRQLEKASITPNDLPGIVAAILNLYVPENEIQIT